MRIKSLASLAVISLSLQTSCKKENVPTPQPEAEVQFVPVAVGAAYGIGVSTEIAAAAFAAGSVYALDCTRPVTQGEIRFFCDAPVKIGQATVEIIVNSTRTLAKVLSWSAANVVSHLSELSKFASVTHLKSAVIGTADPQTVAEAAIQPEIKSDSGRRNFVDQLKSEITYQDRTKKTCNYIAQYEARLVTRDFKGGWMGGTSTRFFARAPSPESAEAMALAACEWFSQTIYRLAPGFAGYSKNSNSCRKPKMLVDFKEAYRTDSLACPAVRVCTSETKCSDYSAK
jgi:hypothetical protein